MEAVMGHLPTTEEEDDDGVMCHCISSGGGAIVWPICHRQRRLFLKTRCLSENSCCTIQVPGVGNSLTVVYFTMHIILLLHIISLPNLFFFLLPPPQFLHSLCYTQHKQQHTRGRNAAKKKKRKNDVGSF